MKAKLMVLASPGWNDADRTKEVLDELSTKFTEVVVVTRAKTNDAFAEAWAMSWWHTIRRHWLDMDKHGKQASDKRIEEMCAESTHLVLLGRLDEEMQAAKACFKLKKKPRIKEVR